MTNRLPLVSVSNLWRRLLAHKPAAVSITARGTPFIETLEDRLCPSASVAVGDFNGGGSDDDLRIRSVDDGQRVIITEDTANEETLVQVDGDGDGFFSGPDDFNELFDEVFDKITVNFKKGFDNTVEYRLDSDMEDVDRAIVVKLGGGSNAFQFDAQQHIIDDDARLTFKISGVDGASDSVTFGFDEINGSEVDVNVALGSGSHDVRATFFGPIQNDALVKANVDLGAGSHAATVNLFGDISRSSVHVLVNGGDDPRGQDIVTYQLGADIGNESLVDIGATLNAGDDQALATISQSGFNVLDTSRFFLSFNGGSGDDILTHQSDGTRGSIAVDGLADALLIGGSGNDRLKTDFSTLDALDILGTFRAHSEGGGGNDAINVGLSNTAASDGSYDVALLGNRGDDVFDFFNDDPTDGILYVDHGFHLIDGGAGFDQAALSGDTGFIQTRQVES
jgi:hypothetical protein